MRIKHSRSRKNRERIIEDSAHDHFRKGIDYIKILKSIMSNSEFKDLLKRKGLDKLKKPELQLVLSKEIKFTLHKNEI